MNECLPDMPRYINQGEDGYWYGKDDRDGPWRPIPAPQSGLPWRTDGPAVQSREPASVAAEVRPLSPAAQAIVKAFDDRCEQLGPLEDDWRQQCLAAALLAVADQMVQPPDCGPAWHDYNKGAEDRQRLVRYRLFAIAAELKGSNA